LLMLLLLLLLLLLLKALTAQLTISDPDVR